MFNILHNLGMQPSLISVIACKGCPDSGLCHLPVVSGFCLSPLFGEVKFLQKSFVEIQITEVLQLSTDQKKPNRERSTECILLPFHRCSG